MPRPRTPPDRILIATVGLIAEHGVSGVTVDMVAATAGVSKATIYRRWPSRAQLVHDAIRSLHGERIEVDTGSLRGDLTVLLGYLVGYLEHPDSGRIFASFLDAAARDPELGALRRETAQYERSLYERAIRRAIERRELPADVDVELFVDFAIGPFVYRRQIANRPVGSAHVTRVVDALLAAFGGESVRPAATGRHNA